jgi:hypothetical protein
VRTSPNGSEPAGSLWQSRDSSCSWSDAVTSDSLSLASDSLLGRNASAGRPKRTGLSGRDPTLAV